MTQVSDIVSWMECLAPLRLSAEWDNTGLLLGDHQREVRRVMTCLTLTPESVAEAVSRKADLVISHHPLPFRPLKKFTTNDPTGRLLWQLANAAISVYCPHTAWDSAASGINRQLADKLGLIQLAPLVGTSAAEPIQGGQVGTGRVGDLPTALQFTNIARKIAQQVAHCRPRGVDVGSSIKRIAIVCGSGGSMLDAAIAAKCDLFLTGEATFHQCLEAKAAGVSMLLIGHFASEKFAMERLAEMCAAEYSNLEVWGSLDEKDPVIAV